MSLCTLREGSAASGAVLVAVGRICGTHPAKEDGDGSVVPEVVTRSMSDRTDTLINDSPFSSSSGSGGCPNRRKAVDMAS